MIMEEAKNYEIAFLAKSEEERKEIINILEQHKFSIIGEGQVSRIKLAYPIKKENFAYFGYLHFSGEPASVVKLTEKLKTNSKILRFSVVPQIVPEKEEEGRSFREQRPTRPEHPIESEAFKPTSQPAKKPAKVEALSNEALEKKLEEILN